MSHVKKMIGLICLIPNAIDDVQMMSKDRYDLAWPIVDGSPMICLQKLLMMNKQEIMRVSIQ